jgi:hypothetical protein
MIYGEMSESKEEEQDQQPSDLTTTTTGYEEEEEGQSLKDEEEDHNPSLALPQEIQSPLRKQPAAKHQNRDESGVGRRRRRTTAIGGAAASGRQMTLFDLDKQLDRQRRLMERMADDVKHLRKQFNQVQRELLKFEKHMQKMKITRPSSSAKRGKRRD